MFAAENNSFATLIYRSHEARRIHRGMNKPLVAATVLRLALAAVFAGHAWAKASVFTFPGTAAYFVQHGLPGWAAYPVFALEVLAAICFLTGFQTRIATLALIPVMLGALVPHVGNGWMFTNAGGGWEYVAFIIAALMVQALLGNGLTLPQLRESR